MNPDTTELASPATHAQTQRPVTPARPPDKVRKGPHRLTAIVTIAVALLLCFAFWTLSRRLAPELTTPAAVESAYVASFPEKTIGVLPFEDLTEDKHDAFLADAVQDDILDVLSKIADLKVISRTSVSSFTPEKQGSIRDIAQSLGTSFILQGTVERLGDQARVTVQLTDARKSSRLWAASYERSVGDIFGMRSEIVQRIATEMQATILPEEKKAIEEHPTEDLTAYGLYVHAKDLIASVSFTAQIQERLNQAIRELEQAIGRDPNFYLAYCQLASANNYLYFFGLDHTPARLAQAQAALNTVVRLRPDAGETHLAKATFYYRCYLDYEKARAELAAAQRALPNNSEIFELTGYIDRRQGLWTESARSLQRALALDPRNVFILQQISLSYQETRQFGAMAAALDRALVLSPHDLDTRVTRASVELESRGDTRALHATIASLVAENPASASDLGDQWLYLSLCERDAAAAARALDAIPPTGVSSDLNFPKAWCQGQVARLKGDAAAAQQAFTAARTEVEKLTSEQPTYGPAFCILGLLDAALGRKDQAIREGEHAVQLLPVSKDSIDG
ncbi:MAG: hypothetical protein JO354_10955, partial [Verrucomicrobia bacterium]|nr:hypothetical protein [Verrucomicrobiota bacterium]